MNTAAAARWAREWERGWRTHDVAAILELYAEDVVWRTGPFRDVQRGRDGAREYVEWAFSDEEPDADVHFGEPLVAGDRAAVEWWAIVTADGVEQTLAGVSLLRFREDGLVTEQHDVWSTEPGPHEPHAEFGH